MLLAGTLLDGDMVQRKAELALAVTLGLLGVFLAAMQQAAGFPVWTFEVRCEFISRFIAKLQSGFLGFRRLWRKVS